MSHIIVVARQIGEWAGPIAGWAVISAIGEWDGPTSNSVPFSNGPVHCCMGRIAEWVRTEDAVSCSLVASLGRRNVIINYPGWE